MRGSGASGQEAAALENMRRRHRLTIEAEALAEKRWRRNVRGRQQNNVKIRGAWQDGKATRGGGAGGQEGVVL
jgi:hypothetical protein